MIKIRRFDNFVFDLYGTLVDIRTNEERPGLWRRISQVYTSLGAPYSPGELKKCYRRLTEESSTLLQREGEKRYGRDFLGEPDLTEVFRRLYLDKGISCSRERAAMTANFFRTLSRQKLEVYHGVKETLQKLRGSGKGVYLLSNAQRDFTRPDLELTGLSDYFDGILISSEEGCRKPSPVFFRKLLERYGLDAGSCLMVGNDMKADVQGAASVGMDALYIHTEISPQLTEKPEAAYAVMDGDWRRVAEILLTAADIKRKVDDKEA